ncbi:MAG: hypothetical protein MI741_13085 [Rhodospirillales bacterium]|nr:hypothetical protein [Rhodospirillales bacterium]
MPYSLRVFPEYRLAVIRWRGDMTVWAEDELWPVLKRHPGFTPGFGLLWDLTDAEPNVTLEDFQTCGVRHEKLEADAAPVWICYVVSGPVNYGIARQLVGFHNEVHATRHVASTVAEGLNWLSQFIGPVEPSALELPDTPEDRAGETPRRFARRA